MSGDQVDLTGVSVNEIQERIHLVTVAWCGVTVLIY